MGKDLEPKGISEIINKNTLGIAGAGGAAGLAIATGLGIAAAGPVAIGAGIAALAYGIVKVVQDSNEKD